MITYIIAIVVAMAAISLVNILAVTSLSWHYIIVATITLTALEFLLDMIISGLACIIPRKFYSQNNKLFKVFSFEKKFYENIGIKKWKDYLPIGAGPLGIGFKKDKVSEPDNPDYLLKFMEESCLAEFMHIISAFLGFLLLLISPKAIMISITLPVCFVNFVLQLLPFFVQRYNRPKLAVLYKRALRNKNKEIQNKNNLD